MSFNDMLKVNIITTIEQNSCGIILPDAFSTFSASFFKGGMVGGGDDLSSFPSCPRERAGQRKVKEAELHALRSLGQLDDWALDDDNKASFV